MTGIDDCHYALPVIRTALDSYYASFDDDDGAVPREWLGIEECEPHAWDELSYEEYSIIGDIEERKAAAVNSSPVTQQTNLPYKKQPICAKLRWRIFMRDGYQCVRCLSPEDLTVDHIIAEVHSGKATIDNLQTLCRPCNSRKGAR